MGSTNPIRILRSSVAPKPGPETWMSVCSLQLWFAVFFFLVSGAGAVADAQSAAEVTRFEGQCFGPIRYQVTIGGRLEQTWVRAVAAKVQERLDEINVKMSTYQQDSDVSRFNRESSTDWIEVDAETAEVVAMSQDISRQTQGAFDITVGPLVAVWKFGAAAKDDPTGREAAPTEEEIQAILQRVGYDKLEVRVNPPALRKAVPELQIDLSAIAKGYAVDQVAMVLSQHGHENFFVEVGEEIKAQGQHPAGRAWVCGIEKPLELQREIDITVPVRNKAIATSGDYRQFRVIAGRRYSHTIDPRSGYPTDGTVALASIATSDCAVADAWATAAMVLGRDQSLALANQHKIGLRMVLRHENSGFEAVQNEHYPAALPGERPGANWVVMVGATVLVFGIALAGMSIGVIFKRQPIKGSCGGLASMPDQDGKSACELCSNPSRECVEFGRGTRAAREAAAAATAEGSRSSDSPADGGGKPGVQD